ncbi:gustatory receptor for sugar taste 64f-like [Anthonomus grandis grandis]|uniref:gustatory receptor for sugar taste 64f-like n=1 Tax=Anthonomus grandis grandis TaxID=2921223 RepID=UPI002165CB18|nr:gustatory receptor for sugar taste 64f-like [Anthonomus grandis grandis]
MFPSKKSRIIPIKPSRELKPKSISEKTIFNSLKYFMTTLQFLGILPQSNTNKSITEMHFEWISWRILYTLILITCLIFAVGCCFMHWVMHGSTILQIGNGVFYGGSLVTMILYLRLAMQWSKLMKSWCNIDKLMHINYGYPKCLDKRINIFTCIFLSLGLADYILSVCSRLETLYALYGKNTTAKIYYNDTFPQFFVYIPYTIPSGIFCTIMTLHSSLSWALNDLFIIITSCAIALRFQQIYCRISLKMQKHKGNCVLFWKEIREDYDRLASFCKELDEHLSPIILLSFFLNIFFLLIQLYHSLEKIALIVRKVYFIFSFVYLIFKTSIVSLYAAWINDESKSPTTILNSVDSSYYNVEISRLLVQISFDKTTLTGCKMFSVKRGIILSVASAIVTYELVLIQFSQANLYDIDS